MKIITKALLFAFILTSYAESHAVEIVVTGSRITNYDEMPSVTIKKSADFLVQEIRLINDSRSPELRQSEIRESINNLITYSKNIEGIELSYGEGFLTPVKLNDNSLQLIESRKKVDTDYVDIFVKVAIKKESAAKSKITELRSFILNANLVSRTEIEYEGDVGLSIKNPEQYRYEIIKKIQKENAKTVDIIGKNCSMEIMGLESRVVWERTSISELTLYIPYETSLVCK